MFRVLLFASLFCSLESVAHPGIGIVSDSKGNIYYTDLTHVWKISNGKRTIAVPSVHTHELYIDQDDNLYGEGGYYDSRTEKFYHYQWRLDVNGRVDTVIGMKEAYITHDFSLARDKAGNEYYLKRFLTYHSDTNHIFRISPGGTEKIFATGNFKNVNWLHPQNDGSLFFASGDSVFRVDSTGNITLLARINNDDANSRKKVQVWGLWMDTPGNVYVAVYSDKSVRRIDTGGDVSTIYSSKGNWSSLSGVFDKEGVLWIMEGSEKNQVRVLQINLTRIKQKNAASAFPVYSVMVLILLFIVFLVFRMVGNKRRQ